MLLQTIESLEDQRWELRRMSLQVIMLFWFTLKSVFLLCFFVNLDMYRGPAPVTLKPADFPEIMQCIVYSFFSLLFILSQPFHKISNHLNVIFTMSPSGQLFEIVLPSEIRITKKFS